MRTLVLNAGYEPLVLVNWQRAICLVFAEKAEVVVASDKNIRSVSQTFALPSVIRLNCYVRSLRRFGTARCTRKNLILRDRHQCQYCGIHVSGASASIDHIIPRSRGGRTTWENVVLACHSCNRRKSNKTLAQTGMNLLTEPRNPSWLQLLGEYHHSLDPAWMPYVSEYIDF